MELTPELQNVIDGLNEIFGEAIREVSRPSGDTIVRIEREKLLDIARYLKEEHRFIYLVNVFGTDRYTTDDRFEVLYNIVSLRDQQRLFLKVRCQEDHPQVASVTGIWPAANWFERETYDMFGITFDGHPDLRRMYMPEDFDYHPLRKEFPLLGIPGSIELPSSTPDTDE